MFEKWTWRSGTVPFKESKSETVIISRLPTLQLHIEISNIAYLLKKIFAVSHSDLLIAFKKSYQKNFSPFFFWIDDFSLVLSKKLKNSPVFGQNRYPIRKQKMCSLHNFFWTR